MEKKWFIVLAAVGIHISIGSVYAWSVFTTPIMEYFGCSLAEVQFTFSLAILFLGFSAAFLGKYVERYGSKKSGLVSMLCWCGGLLGTGLAIYLKSLPLLYLFYGCIGGIGLGVGYVTPVSTLVKWFPTNRGFATGCAIMGFGFAAVVASPAIQFLMEILPLYFVPVVLACAYAVVMTISALTFSLPASATDSETGEKLVMPGFTAKEAAKTPQFYSLWLILFINIFCGIAILSIASPMAQEVAGLNATQAATMVGLIGLFNGGGRIGWATFSDFYGRANSYVLFFILEILGYLSLTALTGSTFIGMVFLMITIYGAGFACIPAYISDVFGIKQLSVIHGYILSSWGVAGLLAPMFVAWCKENSDGYDLMLYSFVAMFAVALVISIYMKFKHNLGYVPPKKKFYSHK